MENLVKWNYESYLHVYIILIDNDDVFWKEITYLVDFPIEIVKLISRFFLHIFSVYHSICVS